MEGVIVAFRCVSSNYSDPLSERFVFDLRKGYAKDHERSRHDLHVCREVFDPRSSLPASRSTAPLQICTRLLLRPF